MIKLNKTNSCIYYIDNFNRKKKIFVDFIYVDSSVVKFNSVDGENGEIPSYRILKIEEKEEEIV